MKEVKLTKSGEYMCSTCKAAPSTGQYPRKWKWKTEKGFQGHFCYSDQQLHLYSFGYNHVPESNIFYSELDTKNAMFDERKGYIDACRFASMVR